MNHFRSLRAVTRFLTVTLFLVPLVNLTVGGPLFAQGATYEQPPVFPVASVVPNEALSGASYKIKDPVRMEGMFYEFEVWSRYGWYRPQSLAMLHVRLAEIQALNTLTAMQQDPLFLEGVEGQVRGTVDSTVNAVKHPFKTLTDIPLGLEKFGRQVGAKMEEGDTLPDENIRGIHEEAKRKLAVSLGVDPYTDNQPLQNALNDVATNKNRGALMTRVGTAFIPAVGPALGAAQLNKGLQGRLANMTSAELQQDTRNRLSQTGAPKVEVDRFMTNPGYTPTTRAAIAEALEGLRGVSGVQESLRLIQIVPSPEVAHFYQRRLQLAEAFHRTMRPLDKMVVVGATPVFVDKEGTTVVMTPMDHLYWNEDLARRVQMVKSKIGDRSCQLYITGTASDLAKQNLSASGVTLHENSGTK